MSCIQLASPRSHESLKRHLPGPRARNECDSPNLSNEIFTWHPSLSADRHVDCGTGGPRRARELECRPERRRLTMTELTQTEIDQGVFDLYDEYCHGRIDRREFLQRAGALTVGGVSALAMAQALLPRYALAQTISFTDQRIKARYVTYPSPGGTPGTMRGSLVQPNAQGPVTLGADLRAAVPCYGAAAETARVPEIKAPLLIQYAETDERVNALWPAYEAALKASGVQYEMYMYPETQHGFHNNSTPRYHEASAKLAWERTIAFFKQHLA